MADVKVQDPSLVVLPMAVIRSCCNSTITATRSDRLAVGDRPEAPPIVVAINTDSDSLKPAEEKALNKLLDVA
jgi:hypothetical protein